jgi:hypothetical protein
VIAPYIAIHSGLITCALHAFKLCNFTALSPFAGCPITIRSAANTGHVSLGQLKVMSAIERCRTAALDGHLARCEDSAIPL